MKQYLAIDIGGTAVKLGIVDETGAVGPKAEESVNFDGYQTPVLTTVLKAAKAFVETQNIDVNTLEGVGVSSAGHTAFQYVPYLNCQNSILLALFLWGHRVCPQSCPAGCALSCRSHLQRCARWGLRSCKNPGRPTRSHRRHRR